MAAHRHADQRPPVTPEERVHLVLRPVPVQVDVGEQPVLRVWVPAEFQAQLAADPAVRPVGPDQVVSRDGPRRAFRPADRGGDAARIDGQAAELGPLLDAAAEFAHPLAENRLGHVLRHIQHEAEGRAVAGQLQPDQGLPVGVHVETAHHLAAGDEPVREAHHVEDLERARVKAEGPGLQRHPVALVDDAGPDAAGQQFAGQHEAGRPRARNQYLAVVGHDRRLAPDGLPGHRENYRGPTYLRAPSRTRTPRPPAARGC